MIQQFTEQVTYRGASEDRMSCKGHWCAIGIVTIADLQAIRIIAQLKKYSAERGYHGFGIESTLLVETIDGSNCSLKVVERIEPT
jgi:hypothetical protein